MVENPYERVGEIVLVHFVVEERIPHPVYDRDTMEVIDRMLDEKSFDEVIEEYPFGGRHD